jgi:hypothetical protein
VALQVYQGVADEPGFCFTTPRPVVHRSCDLPALPQARFPKRQLALRCPATCRSRVPWHAGVVPNPGTARNAERINLPWVTPHQRGRKLLTGLASLTLITGAALAAAQAPATAAGGAPSANPYRPQYQHPYRHGAVPTRGQGTKMKAWAKTHAATASGPETLSYGGGIDGIGVQSGHSKVYLVFYGTQWGTKGTDSNGNATFGKDPDHAAQEMFKGIGPNNETWSADGGGTVGREDRTGPAPTPGRGRRSQTPAGDWAVRRADSAGPRLARHASGPTAPAARRPRGERRQRVRVSPRPRRRAAPGSAWRTRRHSGRGRPRRGVRTGGTPLANGAACGSAGSTPSGPRSAMLWKEPAPSAATGCRGLRMAAGWVHE